MNQHSEMTSKDLAESNVPVAGQSVRLPGSSRDAALHEQLYRYAEDLEQMVERQSKLEANYASVRESCVRLTESRVMLDELIRSSRDIHIVTDTDGIILQANPAAATVATPLHLVGHNLAEWILPSHHANFAALRTRAVLNQDSNDQEWELRLRCELVDLPPLIVSARALIFDKNNSKQYLHWILRDVTYLRETEFETQISTMVFKNAAEGVMITDVEGDILAVNPAFTRITGYEADEVIGRNPRLLKSGLQDSNFYNEFWRVLRASGSWQGEVFNRKKNGEIYPEWMTVSAAHDGDGHVLSYIAVFSDLSRLLQAEKRLAYLAHHDTLTGLPNRLLFQDRLEQTLTQSKRSGVPFTLIFIDLDRFKQINDTLGHMIGDRVLQEAGKRLAASVREVDTVARLGGDEFVILAPSLTGDADIDLVCEKALQALAKPIYVDDHELFIGGSFGCAEYPLHGDNEVVLLKHADAAMYRAKAAGGNCHAIHVPTRTESGASA
jgi:diguanylate cyclase (GGDEF)-like protein/PAS domain S-box-containing protein